MKHNNLYLLILAFLFSFCANSQTVSFLRGMSYNVSLVSPVLHFRIPVELLKGTIASTIKIELADAHSERFTDSISIKAFENFFIADTLGTSFLNIDINNRMDVPPASYVLNIRSSKKNDDGTPPEKYTLTITVNAAVIAAPGTVQIERRGQLADGFECNDTLLYLKETGRKSALINPKFDKIKMVDEKNHPVSGRIILDSQQVIPAGEARELRFATVGEFPVGKTTATMELSGHQLDVPVPLTIEITTRRGKGFLIVLLVAGLSFGYITRILLTYIISINEARLPGIDLQSTLATVTKNRQDTEFISAVDRIGKALEKGLRKSKAIDVTNAITSAKNDLDAAVAAFNTRLGTSHQSLDKLRNLVSAIATLPPSFDGVNIEALKTINQTTSKIELGATQDADSAISIVNENLSSKFYKALGIYRQISLGYLNNIQHAAFKIPEIKEAADLLSTQITAIDPTAHDPIDTAVFGSICNIQNRLGDFIFSIARAVGNTVNAILDAFTPVMQIMPDADAVEKLRDKSKSLITAITDPNAIMDSILQTLPGKLADLKTSVKDTFIAETDDEAETDPNKIKANQAAKDAIEKQIESGAYFDAANAVVQFIKDNPQTPKGAAHAVKRFLPLPANKLSVTGSFPLQQVLLYTTTTILPKDNKAIELQRAGIEKVITIARVVQGVLIGSVVLFVGYTLNADNFIGTTPEIASVFFWAFLINVSLTTLTDSFFSKIIKA